MSKSINKVQLLGNLGKDPEMKFTPSGKPVTTFSMAMNRSWNNAEGERVEHTEWANIEAWGRAAEVLNQYVKKGERLYVEGRLTTERYEKEGETKFFVKVVVQEFVLLGNGRGGGERIVAEEPATLPEEAGIEF